MVQTRFVSWICIPFFCDVSLVCRHEPTDGPDSLSKNRLSKVVLYYNNYIIILQYYFLGNL